MLVSSFVVFEMRDLFSSDDQLRYQFRLKRMTAYTLQSETFGRIVSHFKSYKKELKLVYSFHRYFRKRIILFLRYI